MNDKKYIDELEYLVTGACIEVHKVLGPGLLESVYQKCLVRELSLLEIPFEVDKNIIVNYKSEEIDTVLKADLIVDNCIVLELKAAKDLLPIHEAQLLTYMKLLQLPKGILINFCVTNIIQFGKKSFVNEYYRNLL
jgi:GxxExxY protein